MSAFSLPMNNRVASAVLASLDVLDVLDEFDEYCPGGSFDVLDEFEGHVLDVLDSFDVSAFPHWEDDALPLDVLDVLDEFEQDLIAHGAL